MTEARVGCGGSTAVEHLKSFSSEERLSFEVSLPASSTHAGMGALPV